MTHLVQSSTLAPQIIPCAIADIFVVGPILKCDFYEGRDPDVVSPRFGVHVDEIRLDFRHGRAPPVITKNLVRQSYDFPSLHVRQLWSPARCRPLGNVFWTEASVEFRLYDRSP